LNHRLGLFAVLCVYSIVPAVAYLFSWGSRSQFLAAVIITHSLGAAYLSNAIHSLFDKKELSQASQIVGNLKARELERTTEGLDSRLRHDLLNSANVVMGFADLLSTETSGTLNKKQQRYVHNIRVGTKQMLDLFSSKSDKTTTEESSNSSESLDETAKI
jgi:signal transduction histidine kinase